MKKNGIVEKFKMKFANAKTQIEVAASGLALATATAPMAVKADDPASLVLACIDVVVKMFPYIGAFFIVAGVFKLILAYRNDQPEAQAGAAKDIVIGAVFIVFKTFIWASISGKINFS